jgi:hypothetical protein
MSSIPSIPSRAASTLDLTDEEFAELDELLLETPEPLEPVDAVMLDGYLCGVLVQPVLLEPATWLAHVFDFDGRPLPDDVDTAWRERTTALILRRHAALNRAMLEDGWFDPLVLELDDEAAAEDGAAPRPAPDPSDPGAGLSPVSQALMPWVAGFQHACLSFPDLAEMPDDAVMAALARDGRPGGHRRRPARPDTRAALSRRHRQARDAEGRPQRPLPVRQWKKIQAVPRRRLIRCACNCSPTCTSRPRSTSPSRRPEPSCW